MLVHFSFIYLFIYLFIPCFQDDYALKWGCLYDLLRVIDMEKKLTGNETQIGGFDLVYHNGMVCFSPFHSFIYIYIYIGLQKKR